MLAETGRVIDIKIRSGKKIAVIECISKSACKSCNNSNTCGIGVISKGYGNKSHHLTLPYKEGMVINEPIELLVNQKDIIKSSIIAYLIPLITFVLGASISHLFFNNELAIIVMSLTSLFAGCCISKALSVWLYPNDSLHKVVSTK